MTLIAVVNVYGREPIVAQEDLEDTARYRAQVPLRDARGSTYFDLGYAKRGKATTIHRENIDRVMSL
jgi:hypothetical protein